jgi:hypothetical protein
VWTEKRPLDVFAFSHPFIGCDNFHLTFLHKYCK